MKLTVQDLYNLTKGLNDLLDKELSTSTSFTIARNHKKVSDEAKTAEELRKKIIEKYKDKENEDGSIQLKKDKLDEYKKEIEELHEQEVDVDIKKIKLDDLGESIKPRTLGLLEKIIKEDK